MSCIVHGCPRTLCGMGEALPGRRSITRSCVSPVSCHRATAGLIQASYDRPHLLVISVHGNESVSEIVSVRFDDWLAGLAGCPDRSGLLSWYRTMSRSSASAAFGPRSWCWEPVLSRSQG